MEKVTVYVVTYVDEGREGTVTVFDNREAAEECKQYFNEVHDYARIDECALFQRFLRRDS